MQARRPRPAAQSPARHTPPRLPAAQALRKEPDNYTEVNPTSAARRARVVQAGVGARGGGYALERFTRACRACCADIIHAGACLPTTTDSSAVRLSTFTRFGELGPSPVCRDSDGRCLVRHSYSRVHKKWSWHTRGPGRAGPVTAGDRGGTRRVRAGGAPERASGFGAGRLIGAAYLRPRAGREPALLVALYADEGARGLTLMRTAGGGSNHRVLVVSMQAGHEAGASGPCSLRLCSTPAGSRWRCGP